MRPISKVSFIAAIATLATLGGREPAAGQDQGNLLSPGVQRSCNAYADEVMRQVKFNKDNGCYGQGARWSDDRNVHWQWCVNGFNTTDSKIGALIPQESSARERANKACANPAQNAACYDYANNAVIAANLNARLRCGPGAQGRWSMSQTLHRAWCLENIDTEAGQAAIKSEEKIRTDGAKACLAGYSLDPAGVAIPLRAGQKLVPKGYRNAGSNAKGAAGFDRTKQQSVQPARKRGESAAKKIPINTGGYDRSVKSGGNAAIDRLSGDSRLPSTSSNPGRPSAGGRSPANAGISAVAKPTGIAPALTSKPSSNSTIEYGGCAGCGKPSPDKFVPPK